MDKLGFKPVPAAVAVGLALLIWFVIPVPTGRNATGVASFGDVCRRDCRDYRQGDAHRRVVDGGGDAGGVNRRNQRQAPTRRSKTRCRASPAR